MARFEEGSKATSLDTNLTQKYEEFVIWSVRGSRSCARHASWPELGTSATPAPPPCRSLLHSLVQHLLELVALDKNAKVGSFSFSFVPFQLVFAWEGQPPFQLVFVWGEGKDHFSWCLSGRVNHHFNWYLTGRGQAPFQLVFACEKPSTISSGFFLFLWLMGEHHRQLPWFGKSIGDEVADGGRQLRRL